MIPIKIKKMNINNVTDYSSIINLKKIKMKIRIVQL